jgi:predicted nuclease of predicted toxin-antitoxin system
MQIRLLLDEDVHASLALALCKRGYDAVHIQELQRKGYSDREQLEFAVSQSRCLMSFNIRDFVILHNEFATNGQEHWDILVSSQLPIGETLRRTLVMLNTNTAEYIQNRLEFL